MTFAEGITLGIIGTCLTIGGWVFAMWIYTKNQKESSLRGSTVHPLNMGIPFKKISKISKCSHI